MPPVTPSQTRVLGAPSLVRDRQSNAVINRNTSAHKTRVAFKRNREKAAQETINMKKDIEDLKAQIQSLLTIIAETKS